MLRSSIAKNAILVGAFSPTPEAKMACDWVGRVKKGRSSLGMQKKEVILVYASALFHMLQLGMMKRRTTTVGLRRARGRTGTWYLSCCKVMLDCVISHE
jgi:hypothetical protein